MLNSLDLGEKPKYSASHPDLSCLHMALKLWVTGYSRAQSIKYCLVACPVRLVQQRMLTILYGNSLIICFVKQRSFNYEAKMMRWEIWLPCDKPIKLIGVTGFQDSGVNPIQCYRCSVIFSSALLFLIRFLCCDIRWNTLFETIPMNGHNIEYCRDLRKNINHRKSLQFALLSVHEALRMAMFVHIMFTI